MNECVEEIDNCNDKFIAAMDDSGDCSPDSPGGVGEDWSEEQTS